MEEHLIDLETKLAYLEDLVDSLNQVVVEQQRQIDQLRETCRTMIERIQLAEDDRAAQGKPPLERPPHY